MATIAKKLPPTPKEHWLFGSAYYFAKDPIPFLMNNSRNHSGIFRATTVFKKVMIVDKPDYIKYILQDNNRNYVKSFGYEVLKLLLGNGLLTSEGDFWKKQRRLIQPAFSRERLVALTETMLTCVDDLVDEMNKKEGQVIDVSRSMMGVALNVVAKSLFSSDVTDLIDVVGKEVALANEAAIERISNPFKLPQWMPTPGNFRERQAIATLDRIILKIIEDRRSAKESYPDLLQMLMDVQDEDTGERMSDRQLRDEVITIFLAGHETTALALTWLWYLLAQNPGEAELVYQEVDRVLGGRDPQFADLPRLEYTQQVIMETMRLYPPAWLIGRKTLGDDEIGGFLVPKGTNILMPVYAVHRDPRYWKDPEKFDPTRFEKEKIKARHKYEYFPFGGGQRLCIGNNFAMMEMQLVVAKVIRQFRLSLQDGFKTEPVPVITLRSKNGMMMKVEKRG